MDDSTSTVGNGWAPWSFLLHSLHDVSQKIKKPPLVFHASRDEPHKLTGAQTDGV